MRKSFTESINTTYTREHISESSIEPASLQKVLRLFGYGSGTDARYICCLHADQPRIDIHKFRIGQQNLVMCIITEGQKVVDSALWKISPGVWNMLSKYDFGSASTMDEIDGRLRNTCNGCECLMRYTPQ